MSRKKRMVSYSRYWSPTKKSQKYRCPGSFHGQSFVIYGPSLSLLSLHLYLHKNTHTHQYYGTFVLICHIFETRSLPRFYLVSSCKVKPKRSKKRDPTRHGFKKRPTKQGSRGKDDRFGQGVVLQKTFNVGEGVYLLYNFGKTYQEYFPVFGFAIPERPRSGVVDSSLCRDIHVTFFFDFT